ncbi:hypothetical protein Csa_012522 [Cucumis sativus]|nr:hypothetical protein Csa_012522 [Cucumis sativus]
MKRGRQDQRNGLVGIGERRKCRVRLGGKRFEILASLSLFDLFSHWSRSRGEPQNGMVDQDERSVEKFYLQSRLSSRISQTRRVCGNPHGLIRKYGLMCCRQCFRSNAKEIGFIKLQDREQSNPTRKNVRVGDVNLYDYHPIDPVPSSKRSIKHGPIEHGSPLIPHMPSPSPPDQPQPDIALNHHHVNANKCLSDILLNRKLKFQTDEHCNHGRKKVHPDDLNLDDYHPIDPVPSSKTSVKPGPIEHGAPLLPHMPNPPPPSQPGGYA